MPRTPSPTRLPWNAPYIAKVMRRNGISNRGALSDVLTHVSRATVYRVFNKDWSGHATTTMIAQLKAHFRLDANRLTVTDGGQQQ